MNAFDIFVKLTVDTGDVEKGLTTAKNKALAFGDVLKANVLGGVIVDGVKKLGSAIKNMSGAFIESAADVKAEESAFKQTFGNLGDAASEAIGRVADSSGILQTRLNTLGSKIYAFARSSGGDATESMSLMERALQAAADSAAYYDTSVEQATETLQSFLKGNFENDAALGLSATETTRNAAAMELFGQKYNDLSEIQKQQTLLKMVEDSQKLSGAMGQAAREADGWENVTGNLSEAWRQFQANVGTPFLESLIPVIQDITEAFQEWMNNVDWDKFSQKITDFVTTILDNGDTIISVVAGIGAGFVAWNVASMISGVVKAIQAYQAANEGATIAQAALNLVMNANPIGIVITAVAALVAAIVALWNTNEDFRNAIISAWGKIKDTISSSVNAISAFFTEKIPNAIQSVISWFTSIPNKFKDIGSNIVRGLWDGIKSMITWIKDKISGFVGGIVSSVKGLLGIHSPSKVFAGIGGFMAEGLGEGFDDQFGAVKKGIENSMNFDAGIITAGANISGNYASGSYGAASTSWGGDSGRIVMLLEQYLPMLANMKVIMDSGQVVGLLAPGMDEELAKINARRARAV